ncbi:hypothetical protein IQ13_2201 [Lacibacter cauensis]|uniref:Helix-turn-helix protein n=1 Tax=Lacibacter cauensis TaxID=510947 RepID=A0A562SIT0_9BACT|nr:helix-turn-helix domain-containing protein [Lacibacter cauensis]TWI81185.1 hypothetical protein IQ13_2201 [Lacibacter cauensis]
MNNPFEAILSEIGEVKAILKETPTLPTAAQVEIIDRAELCKRLAITEPTAIRWEKKGAIPCFRIGSNVRYNWHSVVSSLENRRVA